MTTLYILAGGPASGKTTYLKSSKSIQPINVIFDDEGANFPDKDLPYHPTLDYALNGYNRKRSNTRELFTPKGKGVLSATHQEIHQTMTQFFDKYKNNCNDKALINLLVSIIPTRALGGWGYVIKTSKPYEKTSFTTLSEPGASNIYFATKLPLNLLNDFKDAFSRWVAIEIIQFPITKEQVTHEKE